MRDECKWERVSWRREQAGDGDFSPELARSGEIACAARSNHMLRALIASACIKLRSATRIRSR